MAVLKFAAAVFALLTFVSAVVYAGCMASVYYLGYVH